MNVGTWVSINRELWGLELRKGCDFDSFAEFEIIWATRSGNRNKMPRPTSVTVAMISVPSFSSMMDCSSCHWVCSNPGIIDPATSACFTRIYVTRGLEIVSIGLLSSRQKCNEKIQEKMCVVEKVVRAPSTG